LPRGVITIGKLDHDDAVLYGLGLIDAIEIEKTSIVEPRIAVVPRVMDLVREENARNGEIASWKPFIRNRGSGEFVHILGPEWPFVKKMAADGDDGIRDMFGELKDMLPIRYNSAKDDKQRSKIEWMTEYVNDSIVEQNLPNEWKVKLPIV